MSIDRAPAFPSGQQHEIVLGEQHATVVEVGGGIRSYERGEREILQSYPREAMCDGAHGSPLLPWPNRLRDGRYQFDGVDYELPLSEPTLHNAIHGLVRWRNWRLLDRSSSSARLGLRLHPSAGYPFLLDLEIDYSLTDSGLIVRTTATNRGDRPCPFGAGQHPYLSPGSGLIDVCTLEFQAGRRIMTDERQLPTGEHEPVEGTTFDFHSPRAIGDLQIDSAFRDLERDEDGCSAVRLVGDDGQGVELWLGEGYEILQLFTADTLAPDRRRRGLGCEPMTCPPNAFATGDGLIRLESGGRCEMTWGVRLRS